MRFRWKKGEQQLVLNALEEAELNWKITAGLARTHGAVREAAALEADLDMLDDLRERLKAAQERKTDDATDIK